MADNNIEIDFEPTTKENKKKPSLTNSNDLKPEFNYMDLAKKCTAELMGTMFLCLTVALSVGMGRDNAPLGIGLSLGCLVFALGHISGANFNPAVTLAILLRGRLDPISPYMTAIAYIMAQFAGGLLGGGVARFVVEDWCQNKNVTIIGRSCVSGMPAPDPNVEWFTAFLVETVFTMGLALVVLNVAVSDANDGNSFYGLAIGLAVTFSAIAGGGVSGGAFNPAVGLCLPLVNGITDDIALYLLGPFCGGALAALFFRFTAKEEEFMEKIDETAVTISSLAGRRLLQNSSCNSQSCTFPYK